MTVKRTYRVSAFHNLELDSEICFGDTERDGAIMLMRRLFPFASISAPEVCFICMSASVELIDRPESQCRTCAGCWDYDEESALALADAEGYDMNDLEGELAKFPRDQIDFIEFTLGVGGL